MITLVLTLPRITVGDIKCRPAFEKADDMSDRRLRRYADKHMYVVRHQMSFLDTPPF